MHPRLHAHLAVICALACLIACSRASSGSAQPDSGPDPRANYARAHAFWQQIATLAAQHDSDVKSCLELVMASARKAGILTTHGPIARKNPKAFASIERTPALALEEIGPNLARTSGWSSPALDCDAPACGDDGPLWTDAGEAAAWARGDKSPPTNPDPDRAERLLIQLQGIPAVAPPARVAIWKEDCAQTPRQTYWDNTKTPPQKWTIDAVTCSESFVWLTVATSEILAAVSVRGPTVEPPRVDDERIKDTQWAIVDGTTKDTAQSRAKSALVDVLSHWSP